MAEVIVLSDDEEGPDVGVGSTWSPETGTGGRILPNAVRQDQKKPYRLVLVDSRRCPRMPRPRFLPITSAHEALSRDVRANDDQSSQNSGRENMKSSADGVRATMEVDDEEEDSDYEELPPLKRRRTGMKKGPKKHGKLTAPDWEVVRHGEVGAKHGEMRPSFPAKAVSGRKKAREYVKRLTADVDWEDMLRHLEMLRLNIAKSSPGEPEQEKTNSKPRRIPSQAIRLKQYWQSVLMKSVLKMDADGSK